MATDGYHPKKSQIDADRVATWLRAQVTGSLTEIPGIGPVAARKLGEEPEPVTTSHQLIGKFLSLKANGVQSGELCDRMYYWLQSKGVSSHRNTIVHALAEKVDMFFPGTYDRELYNAKQASGDCDAETK